MDKPIVMLIDCNVAQVSLIDKALSEKYSLKTIELAELYEHRIQKNDFPRLILLNLANRPKQACLEVTRQVKAQFSKKLPLIFLHESHRETLYEETRFMSGSDFIVFPCTLFEIMHKVDIQFQLSGLKSLLSVQQKQAQENWAMMDRFLPFIMINRQGSISFFSDALAHALLVNKNDLLGLSYSQFAQRHAGDVGFEKFVDKIAENSFDIGLLEQCWVVRDVTSDGDENWFRLSLYPRFDNFLNLIGHSIFYENINDTIKLKHLAEKDVLTGVANRLKLDEALQIEIDRANRTRVPFSLIMFDIDFFKEVNDRHGHLIGDRVLKQLADLINRRLRRTDVFGRWGGEEFIVVCPNTEEKDAVQLAKDFHAQVLAHTFEEVGELHCSFGVAQYPLDTDFLLIMEHVDKALYRAKDAGRNRVEYYTKFEYR